MAGCKSTTITSFIFMPTQLLLPKLYKGIALFTPGGDLIYCIDPAKKGHWHLNLCAGLQEIIGLSEPPHFLVPGHTATIDRWLDPHTKQIRTSAECYPPVKRHQSLLNVIFGTQSSQWRTLPWQEETCDPLILETYRRQFPELWQEHDLVVHFEHSRGEGNQTSVHERQRNIQSSTLQPPSALKAESSSQSYVLRLFVSGHNATTESTLKNLHHLLEQNLSYPYSLKVIDIYKHPEQAEINQVSATPTLVRVFPPPIRRIVGEWDNMERILQIIVTG